MERKRVTQGWRARRSFFWGMVLILLFSLLLRGEEEVPALPGEEGKEVLEVKEALITVNFQETDIRDVLRLISAHAYINIIADPEVIGAVTLQLKDVSWERALAIILDMHDWVSLREENIIRVTTAKKFKEDMKARAEEMKTAALETRTFFFDFALASEMKESIKGALSERGKVGLNEPANALVVTDIPARLASLEKLIGELGAETVQITIEAKLVEVSLGDKEDLGIDWNIVGGITRGAIRPTTFPFEADHSLGDFTTTPGAGFATGENFPEMEAADFTFGVLSAEAFRAMLHLLETQTDAQTLSAPNITTLSNREAKILTGVKRPIPTFTFDEERGEWEITGYEFLDIGIILTVTPRARPGGNIIMKVKPEVSETLREVPFPGGLTVPELRTKEAETQVMVKDGETLVIGGLMETMEIDTSSQVPLLGDIPVLGRLFRKEGKEDRRTELLIFVTARLVQEQKLSDYQKVRLEQVEASRRLGEGKRMAEEHYLSGRRYLRQRDYERASVEFKAVLEIDPHHRRARKLLRRAERSLGMRER